MSTPPAVRVRFAPSPTGMFHVGSARSVLFNYVFAKNQGGTFVLRIEDTDTERNQPEWTQGIMTAMRWLGCEWDEGPYFQSERGDLYKAAADRIMSGGQAYFCDCSREALVARTGNQQLGYDGFCRDRGLPGGPGQALRFRVPDLGSTTVVDLIRGTPTFELSTIEDFVIVRSNGEAMFLLANVTDDIDMRISHVVRGEEHLPNTPKAQLLWQALTDLPLPIWAHVPVLVNEKRQKLSKRRDKVALEQFRDEGFVMPAMRNYLMTLGWAPRGEHEIVPFETIIEQFQLSDVNSAPAFFDIKKLSAFNGDYIRAMSPVDFEAACEPWLDPQWDRAVFHEMVPLIQTRLVTLAEVPALVGFVFAMPLIDDSAWTKAMGADWVSGFYIDVLSAFSAMTNAQWDAESLKSTVENIGTEHDQKLGKAQAPVRVAVTGSTVGPPLFESLVVLGRDEVLARMVAAGERLANT